MSKKIPKVGDIVFVETERYTGDAYITYIDKSSLYADHFLPIQCEISESDLDKIDDFNSGQTMMRFSLKDIVGYQSSKSNDVLMDNEQGSLFSELDFC